MKILYLTCLEAVRHNGIYETQVKRLLRELCATRGEEISLFHYAILPSVLVGRKGITFPFVSERDDLKALREEYSELGIHARFIHVPMILLKRWMPGLSISLLAVFYVIAFIPLLLRYARERCEIIHCRSYLATILALTLKCIFRNTKVVFDPRGFYPEEGVVTKRWSRDSTTFRIWKYIEKLLCVNSDATIGLSETFKSHVDAISDKTNCVVIHTNADVESFGKAREQRPVFRAKLNIEQETVVAYNGGLGAWHDPLVLGRVYLRMKEALGRCVLLVLTSHPKDKVLEVLKEAGVESSETRVIATSSSEVANYLAAADYGVVPLRRIEEGSAMKVVSETMIGTKVAEYLAAGLPLIVNKDVGGLRALAPRKRLGVIFDLDDMAALRDGVSALAGTYDEYSSNCRKAALAHFSVKKVAYQYMGVYDSLARRAGASEEAGVPTRG
jgi:glycosyltransferase involved in cell wall biosynthesis